MAEGNYKHTRTEKCIQVVLVPDASVLWKTSVSKTDLFVQICGEGVKAARDFACWAM